MGRFSPTVLPRNRGRELGDALVQAAGLFAEGMAQKKAREQGQANRNEDVAFREQSRLDTQQYRDAELNRQRASDAADGLIYDPNRQYGRGPSTSLDLASALESVAPSAALQPSVTLPGVRRGDLVDIGNGYTLDPTLTPEGRRSAAETLASRGLATALESAGVPSGIAQAGALAPAVLPYLLPKQAPTPDPLDAPRARLFDAQAGEARSRARYYDRGAAGDGDVTTSPTQRRLLENEEARGLAILNGIKYMDDPRAPAAFFRAWDAARQGKPGLSPGRLSLQVYEGMKRARPDLFGANDDNSLSDLDRQLAEMAAGMGGGTPPTPGYSPAARERFNAAPAPSAATPSVRPASATPAPATRYQRSPEADRWQQLRDSGMSAAEATAQVNREFGRQ